MVSEIEANAIRRVEILEEIDVITTDQIKPLRKELSELDGVNKGLVYDKNQGKFEFVPGDA